MAISLNTKKILYLSLVAVGILLFLFGIFHGRINGNTSALLCWLGIVLIGVGFYLFQKATTDSSTTTALIIDSSHPEHSTNQPISSTSPSGSTLNYSTFSSPPSPPPYSSTLQSPDSGFGLGPTVFLGSTSMKLPQSPSSSFIR